MASNIENDVKLSKANTDNAHFYEGSNKVLIGVLRQYVEDSFQAGMDDFSNSTDTSLITYVSRAGSATHSSSLVYAFKTKRSILIVLKPDIFLI